MSKSGIIQLGSMLLVSALAMAAHAETYNIDTAHTDITFKVRHMGISNVTGKFEKFGGTFSVDPKNIKATKGNMTIDVNSISTGQPKRDGHLKSEDFFDVAHHPEMKFVSKEVKDVNEKDSTATLVGDLTIRGITKEVLLKIKGGGIINDGWGNERAAFTANGTINRFDYGLKWNKALESGGLVVAPEVQLILAFEGVRKLAPAAPAKAEKAESAPAKAKPAK
ncbi:MAG: YceI family protein [Fibrobacteres bacterium]|nr:YceI family protein [Fibrobacterota bacterium]